MGVRWVGPPRLGGGAGRVCLLQPLPEGYVVPEELLHWDKSPGANLRHKFSGHWGGVMARGSLVGVVG